MLPIPRNEITRFNKALLQSAVPEPFHAHYRKWLQYFFDFCKKYPPPDAKSEQIRLFIEKLKSKKQTSRQCSQAANAISLYFESQKWKNDDYSKPIEIKQPKSDSPEYPPKKAQNSKNAATDSWISSHHEAVDAESLPSFRVKKGKSYNEWHCLKKSESPAWDQAIETLTAEIKIRHYSRKTLKTYKESSRCIAKATRTGPFPFRRESCRP